MAAGWKSLTIKGLSKNPIAAVLQDFQTAVCGTKMLAQGFTTAALAAGMKESADFKAVVLDADRHN
jgi:hypothetical protein